MTDLNKQIEDELEQTSRLVSELTGLGSRWSGKVYIVPDADFLGKKLFTCDILIHETRAGEETRWSTLIHESIHSVSAGYNANDFHTFRGWEEGVVEQL